MKLSRGTYSNVGFSLVEMLIAVGILSIVAVGTSMQLLDTYRQQMAMQSKANMVETEGLISKAFSVRSSADVNAWPCSKTLLPLPQPGGVFNTTGNTDVRIVSSGGDKYSAEAAYATVPGISSVTISKLYLSDTISLAPNRPNGYLSNLYLVGSVGPLSNLLTSKPRAIAAVVIDRDPATGKVQDCQVSTPTSSAKDSCLQLQGMRWNPIPAPGSCVQAMDSDTAGDLLHCTTNTVKNASGICVPIASQCDGNTLAKTLFQGQFQQAYCVPPPSNPPVGMPVQSPALVVTSAAAQTPAPTPAPVSGATYGGPVTAASIPASAPVPTPTTCTGTTAVDPINYSACQGITLCNAQLVNSGAAPVSCTAVTSVPYNPPAAASTPAPAPPNDGSCLCNNTRIANGAYCGYCIQNVDLGYGTVNAAGVKVCTNGVLVQDTSQTMNTSYCSGGYSPAYRSGTGTLSQMRSGYAVP